MRTGIDLGKARLEVGQQYLLSPFLIHHDPRHWKDADTFDPDRWLPGSDHGPCSQGSYAPFGWAPRSCVGASLAITQLILLCHLVTTRYRIELAEPRAVRMALLTVPVPVGFQGTITRAPGRMAPWRSEATSGSCSGSR